MAPPDPSDPDPDPKDPPGPGPDPQPDPQPAMPTLQQVQLYLATLRAELPVTSQARPIIEAAMEVVGANPLPLSSLH